MLELGKRHPLCPLIPGLATPTLLVSPQQGTPLVCSLGQYLGGPGSLSHRGMEGDEQLTLLPRRAATQASEASQMAVRSWPPSKANTTAPPAKLISCCVMYPKPR